MREYLISGASAFYISVAFHYIYVFVYDVDEYGTKPLLTILAIALALYYFFIRKYENYIHAQEKRNMKNKEMMKAEISMLKKQYSELADIITFENASDLLRSHSLARDKFQEQL